MTVHEGTIVHETEYLVTNFGEHYFFLRLIRYNNHNLSEQNQSVTGYSIRNINYYGFEIWEE